MVVIDMPVENHLQRVITMTEMMVTEDRPKRRNGAARDPVMVSSYALATHLGMTRQNVARLTAEGIVARVLRTTSMCRRLRYG